MKHKVIDYYRYVDDILIVYNEKFTNINHMLTDFNNIHPNIKYTMETQTENKLNYLDITIEINNKAITFDIYRKPTTTDHIIHNRSCHPNEHKYAAIQCMRNRMETYPITISNKRKETQIINTILRNNGYPVQTNTHNKSLKTNNTINSTTEHKSEVK
jgi:hypothetical protein